jgi:outer membrane protein
MKKIILVSINLCFFFLTNAQEKNAAISLEEAINYAIEHSYNSRTSKNDIKSAYEKIKETTSSGLPQIEGKVDYQNWIQQQVNLSDFNGDGIDEELIFGKQQGINAFATVRQLLFDGSFLIAVKASKTYLDISVMANEKIELLTRENVINAYGNVLVTENSITILKGNIDILTKSLSDAKKIYKNGFNEEEDIEQLEITLGNLISELNGMKRMNEISYKMLNMSIGNPIETKLILTDSLDGLVEKNTNLSFFSKTFNASNHIDYKIAENDTESKRLLIRLEQSKALPSLSAFINYGYSGFSNSFSFFESNQKWFASSQFGVSLTIPIYSSLFRASKTAQAKIAFETSNIKLTETQQRLSLLADKAKSDYQLSIENYTTAKKNVGLAERIEKKQRIKFFEGISSSFDLLQAQNQLYAQQQNYIQSMLNVISKKATLENALNLPIK